MLSRVADSLYWMSRYLERAENTVRQLDVTMSLMLDPGGASAESRWNRLLSSLGDPAELEWSGDLESMAHQAARQFGKVFGQPLLEMESLAQLRASAEQTRGVTNDGDNAGAEDRKFPAQDAPLQVPAELERLRGESPRAERA